MVTLHHKTNMLHGKRYIWLNQIANAEKDIRKMNNSGEQWEWERDAEKISGETQQQKVTKKLNEWKRKRKRNDKTKT